MEMAPGAIRPRDDVRAMFDRIVPRYDLMNRLMTGWRDVAWRRRAVREALKAGPPPALLSALDVATGTGDLALALRDAGAGDVVGLDFAPAMIAEALRKDATSGRLPRIGWVEGDAMAMPFANESFDVVTVAFGLRNMPDYRAALREMARVLRPGGLLVCLETTPHPWPPVRWLVDWSLARALPFVGGRLTGDADAYAYLPASTAAFPDAETLGRMMLAAGFARARYLRLGLGTVALHVAAMPTLETGIGDFSA
jgi:demethylmenaquinone methyltransferase/2-methoxy-6-polyprenyl-1,4-benzoquinol methylase